MAEVKIGTTVSRFDLSSILAQFRLIPENGHRFPDYKAGQYVALRRENCRLTKRVILPDGKITYVPDVDERGNQKRGPVTHSYSISSAPHETAEHGWLEFYIILETYEDGKPGRLTESLFQLDPTEDNKVYYFTKIAGDFTLERRTKGFRNVVFVGTGTGLAPFASMVKQLHYEALHGKASDVRYTLIHANRGAAELGYHDRLLEIEKAGRIDFLYVPSISRPSATETADQTLARGRANNLLRSIFDLPMKEQEDLMNVQELGDDPIRSQAILDRAVRPSLPAHIPKSLLLDRMDPKNTVILTCGNPLAMADIGHIAATTGTKFEKEVW